MYVLRVELYANDDGWKIYTDTNGQLFGPLANGLHLWDHINTGADRESWLSSLPAVRKSLKNAGIAAGLVLRPGTLESIGAELAILSTWNETLDSDE